MKTVEQRRYPRVKVNNALAEIIGTLAAQITWSNHETSAIADLSYKGFAARRPGLLPLALQDRVAVQVELGTLPAFKADARIAWCNALWLGLEVTELPPEGHLALAVYLESKLTGAHLMPVERAFISSGGTFQYWFQGVPDTHVLVWINADQLIERVSVNCAGTVVEFNRETGCAGLNPRQSHALLVLSQMDRDTLPMEEFLQCLGTAGGDSFGR